MQIFLYRINKKNLNTPINLDRNKKTSLIDFTDRALKSKMKL